MIYIEQIILIDLLIHHTIVFFTGVLTLINVNRGRIIISDILNIIIVVLYFMLHINLKWQLGLILIIAIIIFKKNIVALMVYFLLNTTLGGISSIIYFNYNYHWFYVLFILFLLLIIVLFYIFKYKGLIKRGLYYECIFKKRRRRLALFLDTGNRLYDDENKAVIIINAKYKAYCQKSLHSVDIETINGSTKEVCYKCNDLYIKIKRKYIRFTGSIIFRDNIGDGIIGLNVLGG